MLSQVLSLALVLPTGTEQPPAPEPPRYRGLGMFISSGVLGVTGFGLKMVGTANDPSVAREIDEDPRLGACIEGCYVGPMFNAVSSPFWVTSIGLLGGGMNMRARWIAHANPDQDRRARTFIATGFSLLGAGIVTFAAFQVGSHARDVSEFGGVALRETGWWTSLALGYSGAALAGWGTGYRTQVSRMRIAPQASRDIVGLTASGRF